MLAVHFQHQSGNSSPANSNFGEQNLYIAGRKYFNNTLLSGKLFLDNNKLHFYGFPDTLAENRKIIASQNFLDLGLNAGLNNEIDTNAKLKYWFDLNYDNFSDAFNCVTTSA